MRDVLAGLQVSMVQHVMHVQKFWRIAKKPWQFDGNLRVEADGVLWGVTVRRSVIARRTGATGRYRGPTLSYVLLDLRWPYTWVGIAPELALHLSWSYTRVGLTPELATGFQEKKLGWWPTDSASWLSGRMRSRKRLGNKQNRDQIRYFCNQEHFETDPSVTLSDYRCLYCLMRRKVHSLYIIFPQVFK